MEGSDDGNLLTERELLCMDEDTGGGAVIAQKDLEGFVNVAEGKEFEDAGRDE